MEREGQRLREMALVNAGLHVAGLAALVVGIRPGSQLVGLEERRAWLAGYPLGWMLGWGVWMLCALGFLGFALGLSWAHPRSLGLRVAAALALAGAAVDLGGEVLQVSLLPLFAGSPGEPFEAFERWLALGGLVGANGLYSLSVLTATVALVRAGRAGRAAGWLGLATALSGGVLLAAGLLDAPRLAATATGPTILAYVAWVLVVARGAGPASSGGRS